MFWVHLCMYIYTVCFVRSEPHCVLDGGWLVSVGVGGGSVGSLGRLCTYMY